MSFGYALALLVGLLVAGPLVAHLLRRRKTAQILFPPARLVQAATPIAKQRARLEDRSLFAFRALAVLALALLGASPFVRCERLSVGRRGGGSVALVLVVDDSLSMRARLGSSGSETRFDHALNGAREILSSAREGDGVAIVAAGAPARVILTATTDLSSATRALEALRPSDRATDLDTAMALSQTLAKSLPHADRRVILFSDLADGQLDGGPLGKGLDVPVWVPQKEIRGRLPDCGIVRADRKGPRITVLVACGSEKDAEGRKVVCEGSAREPTSLPLGKQKSQTLTLLLPAVSGPTPAASGSTQPPSPAVSPPPAPAGDACATVRLTGSDAIAADDVAPVVPEAPPSVVAVVSDPTQSGIPGGGSPPIEQALAALETGVTVRPVPTVPDDADDLGTYAAVILDDPPGLTPEARAAFRTYLEKGGNALVFLGPRAGSAILGASFDPFTSGPVRWVASEERKGLYKESGRASLDEATLKSATVWLPGPPALALSRSIGRGTASLVTLPASAAVSELPLRPVFLELLDRVVGNAAHRGLSRRQVVGLPWNVEPDVVVTGPEGAVVPRVDGASRAVTPGRAGLYLFGAPGSPRTARVAEITEEEVDLTPRKAHEDEVSEALGSTRASIDVSPYVALVLLLVIVAEAGLRLRLGNAGKSSGPVSRPSGGAPPGVSLRRWPRAKPKRPRPSPSPMRPAPPPARRRGRGRSLPPTPCAPSGSGASKPSTARRRSPITSACG